MSEKYTQKQFNNFKPTYLYIKRHKITGKKYFGKTVQKDPVKYIGSGTRWLRHIKKHGIEHVETIWFYLFTDIDNLVDFALRFSEWNNIVESDEWLNLIIETGISYREKPLSNDSRKRISISKIGNSCRKGKKNTEEFKKRMSELKKGQICSPETRIKLSAAKMGKKATAEAKVNMSNAQKGRIVEDETKQKLRDINLGKKYGPRSDEIKQKISNSHKGKIVSDETKKKNAEALKKRPPMHLGIEHSDESKQKMSESLSKDGVSKYTTIIHFYHKEFGEHICTINELIEKFPEQKLYYWYLLMLYRKTKSTDYYKGWIIL